MGQLQRLLPPQRGYLTSFWFNAVDTAEWVRAVQTQNFTNVGNTIAFTGLSAHAEVRF